MSQRDGAALEVEKVVLETLRALGTKGFSDEEVAAALNHVEFQLREFPRDHVLPRGIKFTRIMASEITYDRVSKPLYLIPYTSDFYCRVYLHPYGDTRQCSASMYIHIYIYRYIQVAIYYLSLFVYFLVLAFLYLLN